MNPRQGIDIRVLVQQGVKVPARVYQKAAQMRNKRAAKALRKLARIKSRPRC